MKKEYETPVLEVVKLSIEDVITTSGNQLFNPEGWNLNSGDQWYGD